MASNVTLVSVRTAVRQRTHYENSQFVTDAEIDGLINLAAKELYDLLITSFEGYKVSSADSTIASGNTFNLPATFYKLLGVDWVAQAPDQIKSLDRVDFAERNSGRQGYQLRESTVVILPYAWAAGKTFRLFYVPALATLAADGDTFDGVDGWEEYVIVDACIRVLAKAERDSSVFMAQKQLMRDRIQAAAKNRDAGAPPHVVDVAGSTTMGALVGDRWLME